VSLGVVAILIVGCFALATVAAKATKTHVMLWYTLAAIVVIITYAALGGKL
jgi:hypothetical protein